VEIDLTALMGNAVENSLNAALSGALVQQPQQQRHTEPTSTTQKPNRFRKGPKGGGGGEPITKSNDNTAGADGTKAKEQRVTERFDLSKDDDIDLTQLTADGSMWTVPVVHYDGELCDFIDSIHGRDAAAPIQCVVQIDHAHQEEIVLMLLAGKTFEITIVQLVEEQGDLRVPCLDDSGRQLLQHAKVAKRGSANTDFSHDVTAKPGIADNGGGGGGAPIAKSNDTTAGADSTKAKKKKKKADKQQTMRQQKTQHEEVDKMMKWYAKDDAG